MTNLVNFDFQQNPIRVIMVNGEPWFVAKDVCNVLDLTNIGQALTRLDDDERSSFKMMTAGGMQNAAIVNESGLYSLIMSSRKEEAKRFKKWVTSEVLPSIRKTGSYGTTDKLPLHIMRYIENENMLPRGHFSMLSEMIRQFYGRLIAMGAKEEWLEPLYADISMGKGFSEFLKKHKIDANALPTYQHRTPWGKVVEAKAYPLRYAEQFNDYVVNEWIPKRSYKYIAEREPRLLPYLPKLIE